MNRTRFFSVDYPRTIQAVTNISPEAFKELYFFKLGSTENIKKEHKMPQVRNEVKKTRAVEHSSLSNIQMELIKLYSTDLDHDELMELKELLVSHFSQKAIDEAGNIWAKKKLSEKTMDDWLNEE